MRDRVGAQDGFTDCTDFGPRPEGCRKLAGGASHRTRATHNHSPGRGWAKASQIPLIEFHPPAFKQRQIFLPEGTCPMMLLLLLDVSADIFQLRRAYGESSISFLPRKRANSNIFMHPRGGDRFCFAKYISQRVCCPQSDQQMHVICHSADGFGHTVVRITPPR